MALLPVPWSDSTRSMAASMATLRSSPSSQTLCSSHSPWMMTLSTSGSTMALPSSSYRVAILITDPGAMARLAASTAAATGLAGRGATAVEVEGWLDGWRGGGRGVTAVEVEGWLGGWRGGWRGVGGTAFCLGALGIAPEAAVGLGLEDEVEGVGWPPPWPLLPVSGMDSRLLFLLLFLFLF